MPATDPGAALDPHRRIRVMVVDDHPHVRDSLRRLLGTAPDLEFVGAAEDGESAPELCLQLAPDVVLMDIRMPGIDGIEATKRVLAACPGTRVIVLTSVPASWSLDRSVAAGAVGYLLKDDPIARIIAAIRKAVLSPAHAA
jgi:DNA-binding NarL/FixJ family response regulator